MDSVTQIWSEQNFSLLPEYESLSDIFLLFHVADFAVAKRHSLKLQKDGVSFTVNNRESNKSSRKNKKLKF